jgi:hypothetical protein
MERSVPHNIMTDVTIKPIRLKIQHLNCVDTANEGT